MPAARTLLPVAALLAAALFACQAAAFATPTALIRAIYRPLLAGQPNTTTPETMLFTEDTLDRYRAWRRIQPPGFGFAPFVTGPYIIPLDGGVSVIDLPVNGRPVTFQVVGAQNAPALAPGTTAPRVALANFGARQIRLDALSAEVAVSFANAGVATELVYELRRGPDGWRIEDVRSVGPGAPWSLRGVIGAP